MPARKKAAAVAARDAGNGCKKTKKTEERVKDKREGDGPDVSEEVVSEGVSSEDCSDGEDTSSSEESSDEETVEEWLTASKKGRKGKQTVYVCTGGKRKCGKEIKGKVKPIMCESCGGWFHPHCQDLSVEAVAALETFELPWVCGTCKEDLKHKRSLERKINRCINTTMATLEKTIRGQLDESEKRLTQKFSLSKQQSTDELDKKLVEGLKTVESNVTKEIGRSSDTVKKAVVEQERRVDRSHNVVMHNIPEKEDGTVAEKREHDLLFVKGITEAICGNDSGLKVERVVRLQNNGGQSDKPKQPSLLLVRFEKKEHVDLILRKRFGMRKAGFPNMYINKDLTREEREKEWKLRQELKEKGKESHMIFRGRVVPRMDQ